MAELIETWSKDRNDEDSMDQGHAFIWREMIRTVEMDLSHAQVLVFGCNRGGFLRALFDERAFAAGVGVDLARERVAEAEANKGSRPLRYLATASVADAGTDFDIAFSHEVIYLIEDLADHAAQIASVLKPGASYHAVTCCLQENPLWPGWRAEIQTTSNLPVPNHSVADIANAFRRSGYDVAISRFLANAFIPLGEPSEMLPSDVGTLELYTKWKLMFRFTLPIGDRMPDSFL
ncbi:MAG: class I SAM-dependent methyltransferase [Pseudomonadota bacterium]